MKKFTLKSGNTTSFKKMGSSPAKQAIGGDAGEALDHWKKYKSAKAHDAAINKLSTDPKTANLPKKEFDKLLDKTSKSFTKPSQSVKKAVFDSGKKVPKGVTYEKVRTLAEIKKPDDTAARQLANKKLNKTARKKAAKKIAKKALKAGGRLLGGIGVGATLYDFYKSGKKHSGGKAGSKEGQAKWKAAKKKAGKSDIWGKNK